MCSAPAKTTEADIVRAAWLIVAERGVDGLSLQQVAAAVGIKAPSLYKRFNDRAELVDAVRRVVIIDLGEQLAEARRGHAGAAALLAMGCAYRRFGLAHAHLHPLLFTAGGTPSHEARLTIAPVLEVAGELAGPQHALAAARALTAYLHGFVTMEIAGNFQLGGSVEEAFEFGLAALVMGLEAPPSRSRRDADVRNRGRSRS